MRELKGVQMASLSNLTSLGISIRNGYMYAGDFFIATVFDWLVMGHKEVVNHLCLDFRLNIMILGLRVLYRYDIRRRNESSESSYDSKVGSRR